jgi:hypothetical protein
MLLGALTMYVCYCSLLLLATCCYSEVSMVCQPTWNEEKTPSAAATTAVNQPATRQAGLAHSNHISNMDELGYLSSAVHRLDASTGATSGSLVVISWDTSGYSQQ